MAEQDASITSVYIVDDHELIRRGLRDLIQFEPDLAVTGEAGSVSAAVADMIARPPRVAVVDLMLTDGTGIDVCRRIRAAHPSIACLIITSLDDTTALHAAIMSDAMGFVPKLSAGAELTEAIRAAAGNRNLIDPVQLAEGRGELGETCERSLRLTEEEQQIAGMILAGDSDTVIAGQLHLGPEAVADRVSSIVDKIDLIRARAAIQIPLGAF
jgi:DNA-binding NarL/FixJ family response regulator